MARTKDVVLAPEQKELMEKEYFYTFFMLNCMKIFVTSK